MHFKEYGVFPVTSLGDLSTIDILLICYLGLMHAISRRHVRQVHIGAYRYQYRSGHGQGHVLLPVGSGNG